MGDRERDLLTALLRLGPPSGLLDKVRYLDSAGLAVRGRLEAPGDGPLRSCLFSSALGDLVVRSGGGEGDLPEKLDDDPDSQDLALPRLGRGCSLSSEPSSLRFLALSASRLANNWSATPFLHRVSFLLDGQHEAKISNHSLIFKRSWRVRCKLRRKFWIAKPLSPRRPRRVRAILDVLFALVRVVTSLETFLALNIGCCRCLARRRAGPA